MTERRAPYRARQRSKKCEYFGLTFDSQADGRRYLQLRAREQAGEITRLEVYPKFLLQPAFHMETGELVRAITYTPDFQYVENGRFVVEDVKAWITDKKTGRRRPIIQEDCELKIKMLKRIRPDIVFKLTGD